MKDKLTAVLILVLVTLTVLPVNACVTPRAPANLPPTVDFTYSPGTPTVNQNGSFSDSSTDDDGTIASWAWDFGDGFASSVQNPSHSFSSQGNYTVSLTVTDDAGERDSKSQLINVFALPTVIDIGKDEAIRILVSEIIEPADSYDRISAFALGSSVSRYSPAAFCI